MMHAFQAGDGRFAVISFCCTQGGDQVATGLMAAYAGGTIRPGQDRLVRLADAPDRVPMGAGALRRIADVLRECEAGAGEGGRVVFLPESDRAAVIAEVYITLCEALGGQACTQVMARDPEEAAAMLGVTPHDVAGTEAAH